MARGYWRRARRKCARAEGHYEGPSVNRQLIIKLMVNTRLKLNLVGGGAAKNIVALNWLYSNLRTRIFRSLKMYCVKNDVVHDCVWVLVKENLQ